MRRPPPILLLAVVVALLTALVTSLPTSATTAVDEAAQVPVADAPVAGQWTCVAGGGDGASDLRVVAAVPERSDQPSRVTTRVHADGGVRTRGVDLVQPGAAVELPLDVAEEGFSTHRWGGGPAAVSRVWRVVRPGRPVGVVEGPCVTETGDRWVVAGLSTDGGGTAEVVIANPFATDASVAVELLGPAGRERPVRLENLSVPRGGSLTVPLNEFAPQRGDLAAEVLVRSGRVVVEGVQSLNAAIGGIDGIALVPGVTRPSSTTMFPWFEDGPGVEAVLSLANPGDEPAIVGVSLQTPEGGQAAGIGLVDVPAGATRRVPLDDVLGGGSPPAQPTGLGDTRRAALTVDVEEGADVVAVVSLRYGEGAVPATGPGPTSEDGQPLAGPRTGLAVLSGTPQPDTGWVVVGGPSSGRTVVLQLSNPSGAPSVVDVTVWTPVGAQRPPELQGIEVPGGGVRELPLDAHLLGATSASFVRAREGTVVAGMRSHNLGGPLGVAGSVGVPVATWAATSFGRAVREDRSLLNGPPPLPGTADAEAQREDQ